MSRPRYGWWPYVKSMIRGYPALKEQHDDLQSASVTANYNGMPGGGAASRTTEDTAVRELTPTAQREYEAVRLAIDQTARYENGTQRLAVISMVFWQRTHTLEGAAQQVPCHYKTAQKWHNEFIRQVAKNFGLLDKETP